MEIRVEPHGRHVVVVTIDNQPRLNAMTRPMMAELGRVWDELERGDCRCIVLTGAGDRAFCAGADISGDLSASAETAKIVSHALLKTDAYSKPIVAAVNGDCVGGGLELLLATDIRAAAPHARFGLPEVRWSIYPFGGATVKLIQQIGHVHAMDLLLTGRLVDAGEAARLGLVNRVVPGRRPHGVGARDRGDHRRQQPVRGAGGEAADQRDDRRARARARGARPGARRPGAGQRGVHGGCRRVPGEARAALRVMTPPQTSPSSPDVRVKRDERVLTLTLDRPDDQNRLTRDVLLTMQGIADDLGGDDEIQAVVITGSGSEFFSMGILNPAVRASYTKEEILDLVRIANRLYDAIEALPQIVIAAFNGAARAGAAELSLACDIRLAAAHATFRLPEALWGGFPGAGGPVRLPELVGRARALELICTGREIDAAEMERLGLVLAVYPADRLRAEAQAPGRPHRRERPDRHARRQAHHERPPDGRLRRRPHALRHPPPRARVEPRRRRGHGRAPRGPAAALHRAMSRAPGRAGRWAISSTRWPRRGRTPRPSPFATSR